MINQDSDTQYIESRSTPEPNSGCWLWTGAVHRYAMATRRGKAISGHRLSYQAHKGPIPKGLFVCHKCDTPSCVNPEHLFLGTGKDNTKDMLSKGREAKGGKHGLSKLTEEMVKEIRQGVKNQSEMARRFGVTPGAVWCALNRKTWTHIT